MSRERVKYYPKNDYYHGKGMEVIEEIKDRIACTDINDAIEYIELNKCLDDGLILKTWTIKEQEEYKEIGKKLFKAAMRFFSTINSSNLFSIYDGLDSSYIHEFWEIFERCKLYESISEESFIQVLSNCTISPSDMFTYKGIVGKYGESLKSFLLHDYSCIRIIMSVYEQYFQKNEQKYFLPKELNSNDVLRYIEGYIDSDCSSINVLENISIMKQVPPLFQIPDDLRLKAKHKREERIKHLQGNGVSIEFGIGLRIDPGQEDVMSTESNDRGFITSYSQKWLEDTLDYPSIMNNFIYLFMYVDYMEMRCGLVSKSNEEGIFERIFKNGFVHTYNTNGTFDLKNKLALMQMHAYYFFLLNNGVRYEDVLQWVFTSYIKEEFGAPEIRVRFPSESSTYLEKCNTICSVLDSIIKQFHLYSTRKELDYELVEMSSVTPKLGDIISLNQGKYVYGQGEAFSFIEHSLFSDQCIYKDKKRLVEQNKYYDSLMSLLSNEEVYLTDYFENEIAFFRNLEQYKVICISENGRIELGNIILIAIYKDLYDNGVINRWHYGKEALPFFTELMDRGIIYEECGLLTKYEVEYFDYILNKSEFTNGMDLRNKYSHGIQHVIYDENAHRINYYWFLIVITVLAIKINDDFCLYCDRLNQPEE